MLGSGIALNFKPTLILKAVATAVQGCAKSAASRAGRLGIRVRAAPRTDEKPRGHLYLYEVLPLSSRFDVRLTPGSGAAQARACGHAHS